MGCKLNPPPSLPILHKLPTHVPNSHQSFHPSRLGCRAQSKQEPPTITPRTQLQDARLYSIKFQTLEGCRLGISRYPDFHYNANGGNGTATGEKAEMGSDGEMSLSFDTETLYIPALSGATARFLGLPLPPFLKIDIVPELLRGTIDKDSGKVELQFRSKFWFSVGSLYKAPPLLVETTLTSEEARGAIRNGKGERMDGEGRCTLVGVATVDPIEDVLMNSFLGLPTECIAELNARIVISGST